MLCWGGFFLRFFVRFDVFFFRGVEDSSDVVVVTLTLLLGGVAVEVLTLLELLASACPVLDLFCAPHWITVEFIGNVEFRTSTIDYMFGTIVANQFWRELQRP